MLSAETGDTAGVHKSANGNNDEGGATGANDCGNGDGVRATAASPYSSQVSKVSTPGSEAESTGSLKRFYRSARHRYSTYLYDIKCNIGTMDDWGSYHRSGHSRP